MTDADKVASIDRAAELRLLEQLLDEAQRRVPPPPKAPEPDLRQLITDLMMLVAEVIDPDRRRHGVENVTHIHTTSTPSSTRSPQANRGYLTA